MRVFFATDIHGSEICWRKFLNAAAFYKADAVVLGGDVTGKVMVPITEHNGYWQVVLGGETVRMETREELAEVERQIRNRGSYPAVMPPDELTELSRERGRRRPPLQHGDDRLAGPLAGYGGRQAQGRRDPLPAQRRE